MSRHKTPAARALVGALSLEDGDTSTNAAFKLAGYRIERTEPDDVLSSRFVTRNGRRVFGPYRYPWRANEFLGRVGRKCAALIRAEASR